MGSLASKYAALSGFGFLDLVVGSVIAYTVETIFGRDQDVVIPTGGAQFFFLVLDIFLQGTLTLWLGEELRALVFPVDVVDTTGGILFILSLFRQPAYWSKVSTAIDYLAGVMSNGFKKKLLDNPENVSQGIDERAQ